MKLRTTLPLPLALAAALPIAPAARAQVLTGPTLLPGDTTLAAAAGEQQRPDIARGATGYLAVWQDSRASLTGTVDSVDGLNPNTDVYAVVLDDAGAPVPGTLAVVNRDGFDQHGAQVAWNGENYLVVWESTRLSGFWKTDGIYAARVSPTGEVLDDPPIVIEDSDDQDEHYPLVASDGTNWMVLYTDYDGGASDFVGGALVNPAGQVIAKQAVHTPASQFNVPRNYDLEFSSDRYLFVYERGYGGRPTGLLIDTALTKIGTPTAYSQSACYRPGVGSNGSGFFVAWTTPGVQTTGDVRGTAVALSGAPGNAGGLQLSAPNDVWSTSAEPAVAWDGGGWTVLWDDFGFATGQSLKGAQVSAAGTVLPTSPFVVLSNGELVDGPALAGGPTGAVAVWEDGRNTAPGTLERDVYGVAVGSGPSLGPQRPVAVSAPAQTHPVIVEGQPGTYLIVFQSETAAQRRVLAQRVDAYGNAIDAAPIVVATGDYLLRDHDAAWNGSEWLIVWEKRLSNGSLLPARVLGRRLLADGTLLDATPIDILPGNQPSVGAHGGEFLVASSEEPVDHARYIRAQVVDAGGALVGSELTLSQGYSQVPDVVGLADRFLVGWQRRASHDSPISRIRGNVVFPGGTPGTEFALESASSSYNYTPALAVGPTGAVLSWSSEGDIRARLVALDGTPQGLGAGFPVTTAAGDQFGPAAGWTGDNFVVAFEDHRLQTGIEPGVGDVYAGRVSPTGEALDFGADVAIGAHYLGVDANPALAGGAGVALTAHAAVQLDSTLGTHRIVLRTFVDGIAQPFCAGDGSQGTCPCGNDSLGGGCRNSTGGGGVLTAQGSPSLQQADLAFTCAGLPGQKSVLLFAGPNQATPPLLFGDGLLCVGGSLDRLATTTSSATGEAGFGPLQGTGWTAGQSLHLQAWYRDPGGPCSTGNNVTNALKLVLIP